MTMLLKILLAILIVGIGAIVFTGCAATPQDPLATRLASMSDAELLAYYQGTNDRLKAIQAGTRRAEDQGTITAEDHMAKMPFIIGGEAWELEQRRERIRRELTRRNLTP